MSLFLYKYMHFQSQSVWTSFVSNLKMDNYTRKLIVVGENGNGKSSTCNTLLGKEIFEGAKRTRTSACETCFLHMKSVNVWVVDSPGMFEPTSVLAERALEIQKALLDCPKPHAFLIVCNANAQPDDRITQTVEMLQLIFGGHVLEHAVIVITNAAMFKTDADFTSFSQQGKLKKIVDLCKGRIVKLENKNTTPQKKKVMIDDLFAQIDRVSRMGTHCFENRKLNIHKDMLQHHLRHTNAALPINDQTELMKKRLRERLSNETASSSQSSQDSGFCDVVDGK